MLYRFGFAKFADVENSRKCIAGFYRLGYEVGFARESFNSRLKAEGDESSTNLYISNLPRHMTEVVCTMKCWVCTRWTDAFHRSWAMCSTTTRFCRARFSATTWATAAVLDLLGNTLYLKWRRLFADNVAASKRVTFATRSSRLSMEWRWPTRPTLRATLCC
jgi:hypothetical protein